METHAKWGRGPLGAACWIADHEILGDELLPAAARLLAAGLPSVQWRAKGLSTREIVARGRALRELAEEAGAFFVVNGDAMAASVLEAEGLHLPASAAGVAAARAKLPDGVAVGASCHSPAELSRSAGADWVFVSPVFATASKPGTVPLGVERFGELIARGRAPAYALGGVTAATVAACHEAGAAGVATIRGFLGDDGLACLHAALERAA